MCLQQCLKSIDKKMKVYFQLMQILVRRGKIVETNNSYKKLSTDFFFINGVIRT